MTGQANYVINGDFEQTFTGWESETQAASVTIVEDPTSLAGSKVLKVDITNSTTVNGFARFFKEIDQQNLVSGKVYTLSFFLKKEILTGRGTIRLYLQRYNDLAHNWIYILVEKDVAVADWTAFTADFIAPISTGSYNGSYTVFIETSFDHPVQQAEENFSAYFDGFSLRRKL
jgi:hypothetical protein